jgi:hypothetical protein
MTRAAATAVCLSFFVGAGCHPYGNLALSQIANNREDIAACIAEAAQRNPTLHGPMEMRFEVAPTGRVHRFHFLKDGVHDPAFADCVRNHAIQWALPMPKSGQHEIFEYKFNVSPPPLPPS